LVKLISFISTVFLAGYQMLFQAQNVLKSRAAVIGFALEPTIKGHTALSPDPPAKFRKEQERESKDKEKGRKKRRAKKENEGKTGDLLQCLAAAASDGIIS